MISTLNVIAEHWFDWQVAMLWQTAALIAIVWIVDLAIRKWVHPQVRYALWMLVLVKLLIPPTWTSPASVTSYIPGLAHRAATVMERAETEVDNTQTIMPAPLNHPGLTATPPSKGGELESSPPAKGEYPDLSRRSLKAKGEGGRGLSVTPSLSWKTNAMLTWLAGIIVLSTWLIVRLSGLRREHSAGWHGQAVLGRGETSGGTRNSHLPERFYVQLEAVAAKLGLKRLPRVVLTDKVACPAVFGVFRPVLLMPAEKFKTMTHQDTEHILLHELAHIKRGDLFVHAVWMLVQIVYWFNPLLWMIRRTLQNLRELCCDATVARLLRENTVHYRETLLETARQLLAEPVDPGLGLLGLFENSNWLITRLQWLEKNTWKYRRLRIAAIIALVTLMTACVLPMANRPKTKAASASDPMSFKKTFPNGITVELIGVCEHPSKGKQWWKPDGSPCEIDIQTEDHSGYVADDPGYELVFRKTGDASFKIHSVKGSNVNSGIQVLKPAELTGYRVYIKSRYDKTDIKIASPSGQWQTVHTSTPQPQGSTSATVNGKTLVMAAIGQAMNAAIVSCSDELGYKDATRIIAIDPAGNEYTGKILADAGVNNIRQRTVRFSLPATTSIAKVCFQTCPYEYNTFKDVALKPKEIDKEQVQGWMEDFFKHNYRDITARKTLEWGVPVVGNDGSISIRYKYEATIWDKDKIIENKVWTFDKDGKFLHVRKVGAEDIYSLPGVQALVEDFFANNYRDITKRKTIEWGHPIKDEDGNVSIRYKYEATIRGKDKITENKIWTFDKDGKFVSVEQSTQNYELKSTNLPSGFSPQSPEELEQWTKEAIVQKEKILKQLETSLTEYIEEQKRKGQPVDENVVKESQQTINGLKILIEQEQRRLQERSTTSEQPTTNYSATLPNGVTVQLLGMCEHPSEGKEWWSPDGSVLNNRPYEKLSGTHRDENYKLYELLYHVSGLGDKGDDLVRLALNDTVKGQSGSTLLSAEADWVLWPKEDFCYSAVILCEPETETGDIAFLVGSDLLWKTDTSMEAVEGSSIADTSTNGPNAMIASPIEEDSRVFVNIAHNVAGQQVRAIVVDKSGNIHKPIGTDATFATAKGMGMMNVEFDLPLSEIKSIQFQTQKFQPVTFKNISLRPGVETEVEVSIDDGLLIHRETKDEETKAPNGSDTMDASPVSSPQSSGEKTREIPDDDVEPFVGVWKLVDVKGENPSKIKTAIFRIQPDGTVFAEGTDTDDQFKAYKGDFSQIASDAYLEDGQLIVISQGTKATFKKFVSLSGKTEE